jgi:hypothetical protein
MSSSSVTINPRAYLWNLTYGGKNQMQIQVHQGNIVQDGFDKLGKVDLKNLIEITFINQFRAEE